MAHETIEYLVKGPVLSKTSCEHFSGSEWEHTLPETNNLPKKRPLEKEIPYRKPPFLEAKLRVEGV